MARPTLGGALYVTLTVLAFLIVAVALGTAAYLYIWPHNNLGAGIHEAAH